ncbi:hypothetical protein M5U04_12510 [Xenorhabdus sp. XENO-1]|uniref:hypothetical protein n=1 Tax=Xenorhabdus bovienii TaxID=40576 RepID=UPI0020CA4211|nr:hypothetical protein [Xenorhabdus bovienii]MCP9268891.1 hypothetical protein [Xenorhabdus bovienii subsp. africana]
MKNTLEDLNNHLFAQLERLSDEDLSGQALATEVQRAKAISDVATQIVSNGQLALKVQRALGNNEIQSAPKYLEGRS